MATATGQAERIELLDALRGFALFGILLANMLYWSGWGAMTEEQRLAFAGAEAVSWQYRFHHFLVDGKFYTIFSLLFGTGFALQIARLSARGVKGLRVYRRRVLVLLGIGLVHSVLIWDGDILTLYALLGLVLPFFYRWHERSLLTAAAILIFLVPIAGVWLFERVGWEPHQHLFALSNSIAESLGADTAPDKALEWLRRDDLAGWASWQLSGTPFSWALRVESWRIPKVLGIMLIGLVVGRRLALGGLIENRRLLRQVLVAGLTIGVPASAAYALIPGLGQADWPSLIGTVPLALAYAAAFVLYWPRARPVLRHLIPVGRMALTNYLSHSVIGLIFFYGIGFGLAGTLRSLEFYGVALLIFIAQIIFSKWWLGLHEQGPMEAFWRRATYAGGGEGGSRVNARFRWKAEISSSRLSERLWLNESIETEVGQPTCDGPHAWRTDGSADRRSVSPLNVQIGTNPRSQFCQSGALIEIHVALAEATRVPSSLWRAVPTICLRPVL